MRIGVLISGRGSNLQSLIDAQQSDGFPAEIVTVISNIPDVLGLERAENAGVATRVIDHTDYADRKTFENALHEALALADVELVCLAGFMRILTDGFVERWRDKLINIHPSLLPSFKGLHTHERALEEGVRFSGCTIHFVRPAMDDGPIIIQAAVPILAGDTRDDLAARVLEQEHIVYPQAVRMIAEDRIEVDGKRVKINGAGQPAGAIINPSK
ncbi:MAG: phosphoribosylglycinamide formyltransferase, partial [Rhodospirillales bacterium]|nr:phosphoribosylglycinamide formyltransferase [Rhodospirillales bacterium]